VCRWVGCAKWKSIQSSEPSARKSECRRVHVPPVPPPPLKTLCTYAFALRVSSCAPLTIRCSTRFVPFFFATYIS
jgi:hypothetical protein